MNAGAPGGPTVVAVDKATGKLVWGAGTNGDPAMRLPFPATVHGKRRIFVLAGGESNPPTGGLMVLDPKRRLHRLHIPWRSRSYESVNAASPSWPETRSSSPASYRQAGPAQHYCRTASIRVAWTSPEVGTHWNTASRDKDGYLYAFDGRNEPDASLVCVELKTGKVMWREVPEWQESITFKGIPGKQTMSTFRGTLLAVDGQFLCLGEMGNLLWLDLSPKGYKEIARAKLFTARETWSAPS